MSHMYKLGAGKKVTGCDWGGILRLTENLAFSSMIIKLKLKNAPPVCDSVVIRIEIEIRAVF